MTPDDNICYCYHVSRRKLESFAARIRPVRPSQMSDCLGAGTGCGWCIPFLVKLHREIVGDEIVEGADISGEEYERLRLDYLKEVRHGNRQANAHEGATPRQSEDDDAFL